MRDKPSLFMDVLPREQQVILLEHCLNLRFTEALADGSTVFVIHDTARLVQHLPAALPCHVPEVRIFQIERREQIVESAELQKFATVEGTRSADPVEAGKHVGEFFIDAMADLQIAIDPSAFRESGLFARLVRIAKKDLA